MARLRYANVAQDTDGDVRAGATVKFYQPGTATAAGLTTSGTPFAGLLYAAVSGGSPISTTLTADATTGEFEVFTETYSRFDLGIEPGGGIAAKVYRYQEFAIDPADMLDARRVNVEHNIYGASCQLQRGTGAVLAAANKTALEALIAAMLAAGVTQMVLEFEPGGYPLTAVNVTQAFGFARPLSFLGAAGGATVLDFHGTAGPFLNLAPSTGSISRSVIRDMLILHSDRVASGTTIHLGANTSYEFRKVEVIEALVGLTTLTGVTLKDCKLNTRTDVAVMALAGLTPVAMRVANTAASSSIWIDQCDLQAGRLEVSPGVYTYLGVVLQFINSALMDTVVITNGCHLIGGEAGIQATLNTGAIVNVLVQDSYVAELTVAGVQLEPTTGGSVGTWAFDNLWMSGVGSTARNFLVSESNGGSVEEISVIGCRLNDATLGAAYFGGGVGRVTFGLNRVIADGVNQAGEVGVQIGDAVTASGDHVVYANLIRVGTSSRASLEIGSAVTSINSGGNTLRGKDIIFGPVADAAKVNGTNAFLA